ncbi:MAG TPA: hypothetical protein VKH41_16285, partial [Myxococcota bacterium]|nr:hypothetical protein [Myxococcota bacterium]
MLLSSGAVAFAAALHYVWPFTADDAFITFRYAQNWAAGHGPNFNARRGRDELRIPRALPRAAAA